MYDDIHNPSHYSKDRKFEPRKVIEDWDLNFYIGNAVKYLCRYNRKGEPIKDLYKAMEYIKWEINRLKAECDIVDDYRTSI